MVLSSLLDACFAKKTNFVVTQICLANNNNTKMETVKQFFGTPQSKPFQLFDDNLTSTFSKDQLLSALHLDPNASIKIISVIGESRSGKSTLLNKLFFDNKQMFAVDNSVCYILECVFIYFVGRRGNTWCMDNDIGESIPTGQYAVQIGAH